ncbi:MAG TPA: hypothetical protein DEA86_08540 [Deltaproteobacteria bacterium]|nr:hypothetical protein [Deltaproteobacteria bacterium]HCV46003.1 hypothetical protein [Deltaproteobacteria bacterium]
MSAFIHFILGIFVKKRNLKESVFVLTIKALSLVYFMLLIFFSSFSRRAETILQLDLQHSYLT